MGPRARIDPAEVRATLRAAGLRARHGLSQNFLADADVLDAIVAEASPGPERPILEIGPGLGLLTSALLESGASVTAVELDRGLAHFLRDRFADPIETGQLRLIEGDALDQHLVGLVPPPYDVVANLPYHITSPILHRLLGEPPRPERLVLMVQREVAERIAAPPGKMSYLSVFVQYHARVRVAIEVPAGAFEPAPAVEFGGHRGRALRRRRPIAGGRGGQPVAARPGRLPGATQDAPQRAVAAAPRRRVARGCGPGRRRDRPGSAAADAGRRGVAATARDARPDRGGPAWPARADDAPPPDGAPPVDDA